MDDEEAYNLHLVSLMDRLVTAGLVLSWDAPSAPDGKLHIEWNPDYRENLDGESAFCLLATLLADICQQAPLDDDEQALIQILFQTMDEPPSEGGDKGA